MATVLAALFMLIVVALQSGVIFATAFLAFLAFLALRIVRSAHWLAKLAAIAVSCVAWITLIIGGYALAGGDGGLMDGFGMVLFLCFTALVSTFIYLVVSTWWQPSSER